MKGGFCAKGRGESVRRRRLQEENVGYLLVRVIERQLRYSISVGGYPVHVGLEHVYTYDTSSEGKISKIFLLL